jgi:hypothetical protein
MKGPKPEDQETRAGSVIPDNTPLFFKLTREQREYYRYTGVSADVERKGLRASCPEFGRVRGEDD